MATKANAQTVREAFAAFIAMSDEAAGAVADELGKLNLEGAAPDDAGRAVQAAVSRGLFGDEYGKRRGAAISIDSALAGLAYIRGHAGQESAPAVRSEPAAPAGGEPAGGEPAG